MTGLETTLLVCGSGLARDGLQGAALTQPVRVIVDDHREQARSHRSKNRLSERGMQP